MLQGLKRFRLNKIDKDLIGLSQPRQSPVALTLKKNHVGLSFTFLGKFGLPKIKLQK